MAQRTWRQALSVLCRCAVARCRVAVSVVALVLEVPDEDRREPEVLAGFDAFHRTGRPPALTVASVAVGTARRRLATGHAAAASPDRGTRVSSGPTANRRTDVAAPPR